MTSHEWIFIPGQSWGVLELGQSWQQVTARLAAANLPCESGDVDGEWLSLDGLEMELHFSPEGPRPLLQIACADPDRRLHGQQVIGQTLAQALTALGAKQFSDTRWRLDADPSDSFDEDPRYTQDVGDRHAPDVDELFQRGTLWIPSLGVGLMLHDGQVGELIVRRVSDVPQHGLGPLTESQLAWALDREMQAARRQAAVRPIRRLANAALFVVVSALVWQGFRDHQRWQAAPRVAGRVIAIEPATAPDESPAHIVEYEDQRGRSHLVRWTAAELSDPQRIGNTVEVVYLPEAPDQAHGPVGLRDIGFKTRGPYLVVVVFAYFLLLVVDRRRTI